MHLLFFVVNKFCFDILVWIYKTIKNMIKNLIIVILLIGNIFTFYLYLNTSEKHIYDDVYQEKIKNSEPCSQKETEYWVKWVSMQPLIQDWATVKVIENYYKYNPKVERWDIIIYETLATPGPIIKQVKALPNDNIRFDEKWRLYINENMLKNSIGNEYVFNDTQKKAINMYVINWKLQETSFLAFGDNVSNSDDSRRLGWLWLEYFKGKVILK